MNFTKLEPTHFKEVENLFYETFKASENEEEAKSVSALVHNYLQHFPRKELLGYVAIENDSVLGCVFFSELNYSESNKTVYILSPMAVKTELHGKGIGQALINYGHEQLKAKGVNLTMTYGDVNFYSKVGYALISEEKIAAPLKLSYPEGWLGNCLDGESSLEVKGSSSCIPELDDQGLW